MNEEKKKRLINLLIYGGLIFVIAFSIITSIVVNYKNKELNEIKDKNQQIEDILKEDVSKQVQEKNKIFSKNLLNFIDN